MVSAAEATTVLLADALGAGLGSSSREQAASVRSRARDVRTAMQRDTATHVTDATNVR
jgi:preprotein translocase subunit SecG